MFTPEADSLADPSSGVSSFIPEAHSLRGRLYLLVGLLLLEYTFVVSAPHPWCRLHRIVAGTIVFVAVYLFVASRQLRSTSPSLRWSPRLFLLFVLSLFTVIGSHLALLRVDFTQAPGLVGVWYAAIVCSAVSLAGALLPSAAWKELARRTRTGFLYALAAGGLAFGLSDAVQGLWNAPDTALTRWLQAATLHQVAHLLRFFYPTVAANPVESSVTLPHFEVIIAGSCSGIEGLSLTLLFTLGWLWYARRELRFPRALLLTPAAMVLIWIFNICRIALLLAIGNAGHPEEAIHGFHSEAGWIAFNCVSLGFLASTHRVAWLRRTANDPVPASHRNAASVYLLPFLAILAAGFISKATSAGFEWLYVLRPLVAALVIWKYRREYRQMNWRFGPVGIATGVAVFAMWIALSHWTPSAGGQETGQALGALSPSLRSAWILIRLIGAVITVPVAEELAFRGFLMRRLVSSDAEAVPYSKATPFAIVISAVLFGAMHGNLWFAGILAGVAYAWATRYKDRLGEAVAAHATTNLLLGVWVIATGQWGLW